MSAPAIYRIFYNNMWAIPGSSNPVVFEQETTDDPLLQFWDFNEVAGGTTIKNASTDFYVTADVPYAGESRHAMTPSIWSIEPAGDNNVVIKVADQDLVWTFVDGAITLSPADGSPEQNFRLEDNFLIDLIEDDVRLYEEQTVSHHGCTTTRTNFVQRLAWDGLVNDVITSFKKVGVLGILSSR